MKDLSDEFAWKCVVVKISKNEISRFFKDFSPYFPFTFSGGISQKVQKMAMSHKSTLKMFKNQFFKISSVQNFYLVVFYGFLMSFSSYLLICETSLNLKYAVFAQKTHKYSYKLWFWADFWQKTAYFKFKLVSQIRRYDENDIRNP